MLYNYIIVAVSLFVSAVYIQNMNLIMTIPKYNTVCFYNVLLYIVYMYQKQIPPIVYEIYLKRNKFLSIIYIVFCYNLCSSK